MMLFCLIAVYDYAILLLGDAICISIVMLYMQKINISLYKKQAKRGLPQTYVELTDEKDIKNLQKTLDLLDEDDDVTDVWHNWDE